MPAKNFLTHTSTLPSAWKSASTLLTRLSYRHASRWAAFDPASMQQQEHNRAMERNITRDWKSGDVYAPHDLSGAEMRKWRKKYSPTTDAFDALSLNPLDLYKNFSVMSEYVTEMGRIRHSSSTGLRPVNQRRLAKAIRRAVALGLMPSVHRHPEILKKEKASQSPYM